MLDLSRLQLAPGLHCVATIRRHKPHGLPALLAAGRIDTGELRADVELTEINRFDAEVEASLLAGELEIVGFGFDE